MNKLELVNEIKSIMGEETSKAAAERALEAVLQAIHAGLTKKDKLVQLIGFGTFKVVTRKARNGINPKTGQAIKIPASNTVRFTPGAASKKLVNKKGK